jgi:hypothetical protein
MTGGKGRALAEKKVELHALLQFSTALNGEGEKNIPPGIFVTGERPIEPHEATGCKYVGAYEMDEAHLSHEEGLP